MSDIHIPFCRMHSKQDEFPSFLTSFNLVAKRPFACRANGLSSTPRSKTVMLTEYKSTHRTTHTCMHTGCEKCPSLMPHRIRHAWHTKGSLNKPRRGCLRWRNGRTDTSLKVIHGPGWQQAPLQICSDRQRGCQAGWDLRA